MIEPFGAHQAAEHEVGQRFAVDQMAVSPARPSVVPYPGMIYGEIKFWWALMSRQLGECCWTNRSYP